MYYQIKGLVLNAKQQGEADKSATIYSYQWGKIVLTFPGAKKINAKLSAAAEPLTESEFMVCQKHSLMRPKAVGANIINNNSKIKSDFRRNLYALYAGEISEKLAAYNVKNEHKYLLLSRVWEILGVCSNPRRALTAFVLRFLKLSGYAFSDYLKQNEDVLDLELQRNIAEISRCSGDDIDDFDFDDKKVWKCVENYLLNYIKKPSVGIFIEKINIKKTAFNCGGEI
ncbi:MAG: DNA repair protein RecO [Elusimicrobiota bacterium]|jgi:DNA repair protein RecO (recombination protein O)|nr:DNA repair protein RecO [Elusimicrobiota bacterium]